MEIDNYIPRIVDKKIDHYLKLFGAVVIDGPKYSGKTWAGRKHANSFVLLKRMTGDDSKEAALARISPSSILSGKKPRLIGEWQEATSIWDEIRSDIDESGKKGLYILTGSSTPNREGISHSGAGRFGKIFLRTMSLYESGDSSGEVSLKDIFDNKDISSEYKPIQIEHLAGLLIRGGWPANIKLSPKGSSESIKQYIKLIINDDLQRLDGKTKNKHKVKLLLKSLARNESTTASLNTLIKDIKEVDKEDLNIETVISYVNGFDKLYLLDNDEPFSTNVRSSIRVKQNEKRHFVDPSIAAALLNLTVDKLLYDLKTFGFLFEAMVERDLKIYAEANDAKLYHYQDYKGNEIDSVIELDDGRWFAFEIKLGANAIEEAANNLLKISKDIEEDTGKKPAGLCVICGLAKAAYKRPDGVYVIPITALKD